MQDCTSPGVFKKPCTRGIKGIGVSKSGGREVVVETGGGRAVVGKEGGDVSLRKDFHDSSKDLKMRLRKSLALLGLIISP